MYQELNTTQFVEIDGKLKMWMPGSAMPVSSSTVTAGGANQEVNGTQVLASEVFGIYFQLNDWSPYSIADLLQELEQPQICYAEEEVKAISAKVFIPHELRIHFLTFSTAIYTHTTLTSKLLFLH